MKSSFRKVGVEEKKLRWIGIKGVTQKREGSKSENFLEMSCKYG